jgi:metal-dependent amidase/aminoacylase/carboxypeptidase family protein
VSAGAASNVVPDDITLELQPRVCTLSADDDMCETTVRAQWRSTRDESLCLVIVDRPDIKRCWENFSEGVYSVELSFNKDLTVELRDPQLQQVLVSETIAVIKQALQLRRRRRQPWNLLD